MFLTLRRSYLLVILAYICSLISVPARAVNIWRLEFDIEQSKVFSQVVFHNAYHDPEWGDAGGYQKSFHLRELRDMDGVSVSFASRHNRTLMWCDIVDYYNYGDITACVVQIDFDLPSGPGETVTLLSDDHVRVKITGELARILIDDMRFCPTYPPRDLFLKDANGTLSIRCKESPALKVFECLIDAKRNSIAIKP